MKKLSRLMLLSVPFLIFSSVSFGDEDSKASDGKDTLLVKVKSTKTYYVKSDDQSVVPADAKGDNNIAVNKKTIHTTKLLDDQGNVIHTTSWTKVGKRTVILSDAATATKPETSVHLTGDDGASITINVHDGDGSSSSNQPASTMEPPVTQPPAAGTPGTTATP